MGKFKESIQRFGGAMLVPVLMFSFFGAMVGITILLTTIFPEGSAINNIANIIQAGAWTVFTHVNLVFVIGLPISLANKAHARAALESFTIYLVFNYFVGAILDTYPSFGVDMSQGAAGVGLTTIAGIVTLDTSMVGALIVAGISIWLHNKYFDKELPEILGIFQGTTYVVMLGFFLMLPLAFGTALVWPKIQLGISAMQVFLASSGVLGTWIYTLLERLLIPTGLHHFVYQPFIYGPAVVDGGITTFWAENIPNFMTNTQNLRELFPAGGFALHGMSKVFAPIGISAAFYATAKPENRKKTLGVLIPASLTAIVCGITEPFEFTFLFIAPLLFVVHAVLAATLSAVVFMLGVSGNFGSGLIEWATLNWLPLGAYHWVTYVIQVGVGLLFSGIYFVVFRALILKFNFLTPGRAEAEGEEVKMYSKQDYKDAKASKEKGGNSFERRAESFLHLVGGPENVETVANCASRLRLRIKDIEKMAPDQAFRDAGAHGTVIKPNMIQIIVGLDVPQVREEFEKQMLVQSN